MLYDLDLYFVTFDLYQLEHMKLRLQDEIDEKEKVQEQNIHLESELKALKKLEKSVQKIDRSKKKLEQEFMSYKVLCCCGYWVSQCQGQLSTGGLLAVHLNHIKFSS